MPIDIDSLSYEELLELRHVITQRLNFLDSLNPKHHSMNLRPGDEVYFSHPRHGRQKATLLAVHAKTVTVVTGSGQRWDVAPHLLKKIIRSGKSKGMSGNIIKLKKK